MRHIWFLVLLCQDGIRTAFENFLFQIVSLKMQIQSQESDLKSQEDDISRAKGELNRLQQEETQLEQSIQAGKVQLETIIKSLKSTQEEINQVKHCLCWWIDLIAISCVNKARICRFWPMATFGRPTHFGNRLLSLVALCVASSLPCPPTHALHT